MTFKSTSSLSGMICFNATRHPAKTPSKPAISRYLAEMSMCEDVHLA